MEDLLAVLVGIALAIFLAITALKVVVATVQVWDIPLLAIFWTACCALVERVGRIRSRTYLERLIVRDSGRSDAIRWIVLDESARETVSRPLLRVIFGVIGVIALHFAPVPALPPSTNPLQPLFGAVVPFAMTLLGAELAARAIPGILSSYLASIAYKANSVQTNIRRLSELQQRLVAAARRLDAADNAISSLSVDAVIAPHQDDILLHPRRAQAAIANAEQDLQALLQEASDCVQVREQAENAILAARPAVVRSRSDTLIGHLDELTRALHSPNLGDLLQAANWSVYREVLNGIRSEARSLPSLAGSASQSRSASTQSGDDLDNACRLLGVDPTDDLATIRRQYYALRQRLMLDGKPGLNDSDKKAFTVLQQQVGSAWATVQRLHPQCRVEAS